MTDTAKPYIVDRSDWGTGPWETEPDRVDFIHAGFACMLLRGPTGHWCGYVGVPREHPAFARDYDAVDVDVHGGLTYASPCSGHICHVPQPGMPDDVWWLGFDCGHAGDFSPRFNRYWGEKGYPFPEQKYDHQRAMSSVDWQVEKYRAVAYVRAETERLADQLAHME